MDGIALGAQNFSSGIAVKFPNLEHFRTHICQHARTVEQINELTDKKAIKWHKKVEKDL